MCRGHGTVRDSAGREEVCACTERPSRDLDVAPNPGWVGEALEDALRRSAEHEARRREHVASCTVETCDLCGRYRCGCGLVSDTRPCAACAEREQLARVLAPLLASVPRRFRWALEVSTVDELRGRVKAAPELLARALLHPPAANVLFLGDTQAGKTSLAVAMLGAFVRGDPTARSGARFAEAFALAGARERYPLGLGECPEVEAAINASLLVIDDLGAEGSDHKATVPYVIFARHNADRPTWVTTGFGFDAVLARYGAAIARRVFEGAKRVKLGSKVAA